MMANHSFIRRDTPLVISVLAFLAIVGVGQTKPTAPQTVIAAPLTYEVVSVKPANPNCLGMSIGGSPGRFTARCITLWGLLYNAYQVRFFNDYAPGLPDWGDRAKFDIDAKMSDDAVAALTTLINGDRAASL